VPGEPQAMVAQYDSRVSRVTIAVPWKHLLPNEQPAGTVRFIARQSGPAMKGATVTVTDVEIEEAGIRQPQPDLCEISISYPEGSGLPNETWRGVPRDVTLLPRVLNGGASDATAD